MILILMGGVWIRLVMALAFPVARRGARCSAAWKGHIGLDLRPRANDGAVRHQSQVKEEKAPYYWDTNGWVSRRGHLDNPTKSPSPLSSCSVAIGARQMPWGAVYRSRGILAEPSLITEDSSLPSPRHHPNFDSSFASSYSKLCPTLGPRRLGDPSQLLRCAACCPNRPFRYMF